MAFFDNELTTEGNDSIGGILQEFGNLLQTSLVSSLFDKGAADTGTLSQSIQFEVDFTGSAWMFELSMEDYGKFIDQGVSGIGGERKTDSLFGNGRKGDSYLNVAPQSSFKFGSGNFSGTGAEFKAKTNNWAYRKGLNPFAVRSSLFRKGLKPNFFYSEIVDENLINELVKKLESFGAVALEKEIANSIKGSVQ
jgi:hypothetical protein